MPDFRAGELRRAAAHEAGHTVVALGFGVAVKGFAKVGTEGMPAALKAAGCDFSTATEFSGLQTIEPRRQLLVAMAGIAAEELVFGAYNKRSAAEDFAAIAPNVLDDAQVRALMDIGQSILRANGSLFDGFREQLESWLNKDDCVVLPGDAFNKRFREQGKVVDVSKDLDERLPS